MLSAGIQDEQASQIPDEFGYDKSGTGTNLTGQY